VAVAKQLSFPLLLLRVSAPSSPWPPLGRGSPMRSWRDSTGQHTTPITAHKRRSAAPTFPGIQSPKP